MTIRRSLPPSPTAIQATPTAIRDFVYAPLSYTPELPLRQMMQVTLQPSEKSDYGKIKKDWKRHKEKLDQVTKEAKLELDSLAEKENGNPKRRATKQALARLQSRKAAT